MSIRFFLFFLAAISVLSSCERVSPATTNTEDQLGYLQLDSSVLKITVLKSDLNAPWDITDGPGNNLWVSEIGGLIYEVDSETGESKKILQIPEVYHKKSHGLLGIVSQFNADTTPGLFVHYTFKHEESLNKESIFSRIVAYEYLGGQLINPKTLLDSIPGNNYHNGSRLALSPDGKLFFSMGDAGAQHLTQDTSHFYGKILRLNSDGSIPDDNPYADSYVYAMGHRNPQGMIFTDSGLLYISDHGPNNDDEINLISAGGNYGWPQVQGFADTEEEQLFQSEFFTVDPLWSWTPTIATAGLAWAGEAIVPEWSNSLLNVSLKGRSLRVLSLDKDGSKVLDEKIYFQNTFGRMRDVHINKSGQIFIITSNTDWHPKYQPWMYEGLPDGPDVLLKLEMAGLQNINDSTQVFREDTLPMMLFSEQWAFEVREESMSAGQMGYLAHCALCHGPEGQGAGDVNPPLVGTDWVTGDKGRLIRTVLFGLSEPIEVNGVSYNYEMPGNKHLDNEVIANILTYIRNSFGNDANPVIPGEVGEERKSGLL